MERTRVLIADDHILVAEAFKRLLELKYQIVGVATNGRDLLSAVKANTPDLVLLDLGMPTFSTSLCGQSLFINTGSWKNSTSKQFGSISSRDKGALGPAGLKIAAKRSD
jgi:DNA-binding NtrC family response regulator